MGEESSVRAVALLVALVATIASASSPDPSQMRQAIARYQEIAAHGGWSPSAVGPVLRRGSRDGSVPSLRDRLAATHDLRMAQSPTTDPNLYDASVEAAVRRFQARHGLRADGVVGGATRAALAVPVEERIAQLQLGAAALARPAPGRRWIRINVPRFWLEVLDGDAVVLDMPVIVGRASRPTPTLDGTISWILVHPPWTVPPLLAYEDLLPKIRRDPGYLASRGIEIFDGWRPDARRLDPATIDWQAIGTGIRDLTLRQRAGAGNALGRLLFYMDNGDDVYLHDTPSRELFRHARRDFSSGCIRVADAVGLAREILRDDADWPAARLDAALGGGDTVPIRVAAPMPIRIVYQPAWVDDGGVVNFRDDIYGEAARRAPPADARVGAPRQEPDPPTARAPGF